MTNHARKLSVQKGRRLAAAIALIPIAGCAPQSSPQDLATCADGIECRSVSISGVLVRGHPTQSLFSELVTDDPAAFVGQAALVDAMAHSGVDIIEFDAPLRPPRPELCPVEEVDHVLMAQHDRLLEGEGGLVCSSSYNASYLIIVRPDGSIACIENRFAYSCM